MKLEMRLMMERGIRTGRSWEEIAFMVNQKFASRYTPVELRAEYDQMPHLGDKFRGLVRDPRNKTP